MKVGVVGATGYTGQGLLWVLSGRPGTEVTLVTSRGEAGKSLGEASPPLLGSPGYQDLVLQHPDSLEDLKAKSPGTFPEVFFLCVSHGASMELAPRILALGSKVIDLTGDFRLKDKGLYPLFYKLEHTAPGLLGEAVYGLPELHRDEIRKASLVANPGCYPTSIILALAPLAKGSLLDQSFPPIADSKSGVSGAGKRSEAGYSFTELNDNFKAYKLVGHQHTPEAAQELSLLQNAPLRLSFTPHLAPMSRGILSTVYCRLSSEKSAQELIGLYKDFYRGSPFVRVRGEDPPAVLDVRGTNFCDLAVFHDKEAGLYKIVSAIDNLARGASVQAAVNLNLMAGKPEDFAMPMTPFRP